MRLLSFAPVSHAATIVNGTGTNVVLSVHGVPCVVPPGDFDCGNACVVSSVGDVLSRDGVLIVGADGSEVVFDPLNEFVYGFGAAIFVGMVVRVWRRFAFSRAEVIDPL